MFHKKQKKQKKQPRIARISQIWGALLLCMVFGIVTVRAERKSSVGASIDFMAGATNQAGSSTASEQDISAFYSAYPSLELQSKGEHSNIGLQYTVIGERFEMQPMIKTISHTFSGTFSAQLGKRARLRLSDTLNTAPDYSTVAVLKGLVPVSGGYQFVFEPQLYKRSQLSDSANMGLDVDLNEKSSLTFSASGSLRHYFETADSSRFLADQLRIGGDFGYSRKQSNHTTWTIKYSVWQNYYEIYENKRSHSATIGFSHKLAPSVQFDLSAGPAFTENSSDNLNYVVSANLSKQLETNRFSFGYSRTASDSTGLGGSTSSHQGQMSFSQRLGRNTTLNFQASVYKQKLYDFWGVRGAFTLARQLGRYCVVQLGSSYNGDKDYSSKRFYASFGFRKSPRSI